MHNDRALNIGTRKSDLAMWQARHLQSLLRDAGISSVLTPIDSAGDLDKESDLHHFQQTGVFTRALDIALLNKDIDLAIHSLKDYPTTVHPDIEIIPVGSRANPADILVKGEISRNISETTFIIGTGSVRRRAQWKYKYPDTRFAALRGNVPTRLQKLKASDWDGIIMAYAGMDRLGRIDENCVELTWMIPAPAQGILGVTYRKKDHHLNDILSKISNRDLQLCASIERLFLNKLEGGCSAPIGALAITEGDHLKFRGSLHDPDGSTAIYLEKFIQKEKALDAVGEWVREVLEKGGSKIMHKLKFK